MEENYESVNTKPFEFLKNCDPALILSLLKNELSQTIALVLSYLDADKAAVILQNLPHETQSSVARKIVLMNTVNAAVLKTVEGYFEKKLASSSTQYARSGGVEAIVEILDLVDTACERQITEALEDEDPELAEEIKRRMFSFENITRLDDRAIQKVMREVDSQELAKALKASDAKVQQKIFRNMSKRASDMLKEDMEYMGPIRLIDAEHAQQKIISIVRHLEDTGEIVVARRAQDHELVDGTLSNPDDNFRTASIDDFNLEDKPFFDEEFSKLIGSLDKEEIKKLIKLIDIKTIKIALSSVSEEFKKRFLKQFNIIKKIKFNTINIKSANRIEYMEAQSVITDIVENYRDNKPNIAAEVVMD